MKHSCIVGDDDPMVIEQIVEYIAEIPYLKILNTYVNPIAAVTRINALSAPLDFLFTGVIMRQLSGIDLAKSVSANVKNIVLVSDHLKYAIDGYDLNAKHFLHKPFSFSRFEGIVKTLCREENSFIHIRSGKTNLDLKLQDIIDFEASLNYVHVHTMNKLYICYFPLKEVETMLPPNNNFIQINRSHIINICRVEKIEGHTVYLNNSIVVERGSTFKAQFKDLLEGFNKF